MFTAKKAVALVALAIIPMIQIVSGVSASNSDEIDRAYQMCLGRLPDESGKGFWLTQPHSAYGICASPESVLRERSLAVGASYGECLGRLPDNGGFFHWIVTDNHRPIICGSEEARRRNPSASIVDSIRATFPESPDFAVKVAKCESGLRLDAVGPDGNDRGLMQVRISVHRRMLKANGISESDLFTLDGNLRAARLIFDEAGGSWRPWVCARKV